MCGSMYKVQSLPCVNSKIDRNVAGDHELQGGSFSWTKLFNFAVNMKHICVELLMENDCFYVQKQNLVTYIVD